MNVLRVRSLPPLAVAVLALSPPAQADRIDDIVRMTMERQHIPGLSLVVVRSGKIVKRQGYGFANQEWGIRATPETVYQIGSITKTFTAVGVLLLRDEGKLSLDDPLGNYVPEAPVAWRSVPLRRLLEHTSGIPGEIGNEGIERLLHDPSFTPTKTLTLVKDTDLMFAPGTRWNYSNMGYYLLGLVLERVSGKPCARFFRERIFQPLGLSRTSANDSASLIPGRASGYRFADGRYFNAEPVPPAIPFTAGYLLSTVDDLIRWDASVAAGRLLSSRTVSEMWRPVRLSDGSEETYGLGWIVGKWRNRGYVGHSGGIHGFSSFLLRLPEENITVALLCNTETGLGNAAFRIAACLLPEPPGTREVSIVFKPKGPVRDVLLAGEFTEWDPVPMVRKHDRWEIRVRVAPGTYGYKFVVDGTWTTDPANPKTRQEGEYVNSLLTVR
ncbi:MAG: serine hydrolase [Capsulimonadales bacterium]|nr:serine hydrolase [Capsulimonadales bacterium]